MTDPHVIAIVQSFDWINVRSIGLLFAAVIVARAVWPMFTARKY